MATGVLTLKDQLFGAGKSEQVVVITSRTDQSKAQALQRFVGVAGHLAQSRALLDFLDQNNHRTVYLDVGFPALLGVPATRANVLTKTIPYKGGEKTVITEIALMTKCQAGVPVSVTNPQVSDGCTGTSLDIQSPETTDSYTFFEHGVPRIKGYFAVDVTGGLQMGLSPVFLKPLTFAQATQG